MSSIHVQSYLSIIVTSSIDLFIPLWHFLVFVFRRLRQCRCRSGSCLYLFFSLYVIFSISRFLCHDNDTWHWSLHSPLNSSHLPCQRLGQCYYRCLIWFDLSLLYFFMLTFPFAVFLFFTVIPSVSLFSWGYFLISSPETWSVSLLVLDLIWFALNILLLCVNYPFEGLLSIIVIHCIDLSILLWGLSILSWDLVSVHVSHLNVMTGRTHWRKTDSFQRAGKEPLSILRSLPKVLQPSLICPSIPVVPKLFKHVTQSNMTH